MTEEQVGLLRIRDWNGNFETNKSRKLKTLNWLPIPIFLDSDEYTELIDHEQGPAHFGVWIALVQVAARCSPRGTLLRGSRQPHTPASLARITRIPQDLIAEALRRLTGIGWIEVLHRGAHEVPGEGHHEGTLVPPGGHDEGTEVPAEGQQREEGRKTGRSVDLTVGKDKEAAGSPSATAPSDRPQLRVDDEGRRWANPPSEKGDYEP